jgi:hypothetical protein
VEDVVDLGGKVGDGSGLRRLVVCEQSVMMAVEQGRRLAFVW